MITLGDLFTDKEISEIRDNGYKAKEIYTHIVTEEKMKEINRVTGQINDRKYWSYRLEHFLEGLK